MSATLKVRSTTVVFDELADAQAAFDALSKGTVTTLEMVDGKYTYFEDDKGLTLSIGADEVLPAAALDAQKEGRLQEYLDERRQMQERIDALGQKLQQVTFGPRKPKPPTREDLAENFDTGSSVTMATPAATERDRLRALADQTQVAIQQNLPKGETEAVAGGGAEPLEPICQGRR